MKWEERPAGVHHLRSGDVDIVVHRHIDYEAKTWLLSCYGVRIDKVRLKNTDLEKAKEEAVLLVGAYLRKLTRDWQKVAYVIDDEGDG